MSNRGLAQLATAWREVARRLWKGIYLHRSWGGEYKDAAILVAIAVNEDGYREVLGIAEGMKEGVSFFRRLRARGLDGVSDKCRGMMEAVGEEFPLAKYKRCTVPF